MQTTRPRRNARPALAARTAPWLCGLILAALPGMALGQSLNTSSVRITQPVTLAQPTVRLANPTVTLRPTTIQPVLPNAVRTAPGVTLNTLPNVDAVRVAPSAIAPESATTLQPQIGTTVGTAGLGRLVAPGSEESSVVVTRIGSAAHAATPTLTADFDGDGLINFEIARGIVDPAAADGGTADGSLVGRHIAMPAGTADRVLDSVINVEGVVAATTFEVSNGTVVLGGLRTSPAIGVVDALPVPDGPTAPDPDGRTGHIPDQTRGDDHADGGNTGDYRDPTLPDCPTGVCQGEGPKPSPDNGPALIPPFEFSGNPRPMPSNSDFESEPGDLINVSIMLPLRNREREGDQFSNYGNEEIW